MATKTSRSVKLLDLNQDVLHEIFGYIDRNHLYFCVKNVCQAMKIHVESFMPAKERFMIVDQYHSSQYFINIISAYMFKGRSSPLLLCLRAKPAFPLSKPMNNSKESVTWVEPIGYFGGLIQERVIVGYFCVEKIAKPKSLHYLREKLGRKQSTLRRFSRLVPYLYEYEESTNAWKNILPHKREQMVCREYQHKVHGELSFSVIGNAIIVGLSMKSSCQWKEVGDPNYAWSESLIAKFHFYNIKDSYNIAKYNISSIEYSVSIFALPSQIIGDKMYHTVSLKNPNQMIPSYDNYIYLYGFNIINGCNNFFICQLQSKLFKLNALDDGVRYHKLPIREGRKKCVSFKLRNNIYTIGLYENSVKLPPRREHQREEFFREFLYTCVSTWYCDRYDIDKDEFYASENEIPSFISDVYGAETALNESYAFILTNVGLIPFSNENGFEYDGRFPYYMPYNPISKE